MNNLLVCLFFFVILCSCEEQTKKTETQAGSDTVDTSSLTIDRARSTVSFSHPLLQTYEDYLDQMKHADPSYSTQAANKYKELFNGQKENMCDSAYVLFSTFYQLLTGRLNAVHREDTTNYDPLIYDKRKQKEPVLSPTLTAYRSLLKDNGFEVAMEEGSTYIKQDRNFIAHHFYSFVSKTMKEYLTQQNTENKQGFSTDGGLVITPTQLADRVLWWENFNAAHPAFLLSKTGESMNKYYLTIFLIGMDNTPVYYENPYVFTEDFAAGYQYVVTQFPNSYVAKIVAPYYTKLKQKKFVEAEALLQQYKKEKVILEMGD